jgi:glycosyltransferase involved in cell wall biosynthesis
VRTKLLFVVNVDWFFMSHRLPIALAALEQGYEVHVATTITNRLEQLRALGLAVHPLNIKRGGTSALHELQSFWQLAKVIRAVRPDIAHLVTIKPVLFGGIAARLMQVPGVLAAVPGLGTAFTREGARAQLLQALLLLGYRLALGKRNLKAVFQNPDDRDKLIAAAALAREKCVLIKGSGVDLTAFAVRPFAAGLPVVVMVARLLTDKGVIEFVEAARQLRLSGAQARFCLVGEPDNESRTSVTAHQLAQWKAEAHVEFWGYRHDIANVLAQAHVVVLPSYREGLPKVLLEAAASGRAVITTDVPGCRDAIKPGVTGLLIPARDSAALGRAMQRLIEDRPLRETFGRAGRQLAEQEFSISLVVDAHMKLYRQLLQAV